MGIKRNEGVPTPGPGLVLFKNPIKSKSEEEFNAIEEKAKKLPPKEKEEFFKVQMADMWASLEIVSVGENCLWLKEGDIGIGTPDVVRNAEPTPNEEYMVVRESSFKLKW